MLEQLFPTTISRSFLGIDASTRGDMREWALEAYNHLNEHKKPWGRINRTPLNQFDDRFQPFFSSVQTRIESELSVQVTDFIGREIIQFQGEFLPPHVEDTTFSAIYWISVEATPNPAQQDYSGCLVLQHPAGPFGTKKPPLETRVHMIEPKDDMLLIFPSHLLHFTHPYRGVRPNVAVHFEIEVA